MAIIYSYPELPFNKLTGDDLFVVTDVDSTTDNPTRSLSLDNVVKYIKESAGSGVGTINRIPKFKNTGTTTLEDSILLQNTLATSVAVDGDLTFADNKKILLGNSSDLQLYHDNTDSRIINSTGDLIVDTGTLRVRNAAGAKKVIVANSTSVELYHNDVKKLETTSAGITVTGTQSSFSGQVTIPTTPVASTDAASKAYVDGLTARKIFTSTSLDTTTDYNTVAATPIVWDSEIIKDSIYTHDNAVNPEQVTVTEAGTYRVYSMLTATTLPVGTGQRVNVSLRIAINGTATGRLGAGMYIRGQTGITESSATIEETMVLSANDIITITGERGSTASANTFNVSGASFFSIEKIA